MKSNTYDFDVIVVGGGHAGIEAAYAAARMGSKTALITLDLDKIGYMPCNPAIGGIGKGHIVFEISALGGLMPELCTQTYLQARMLNTKKGPAVQGLRLQIDKEAYSTLSKKRLMQTKNLTIIAGSVEDIIINSNAIQGIITADEQEYHAPSIIFTTGTFLNGRIHIGTESHSAGRRGEKAVTKLSEKIKKIGLQLGRLKTGTPPRLLRSSIDFSQMTYQVPDNLEYLFEFAPHKVINTHACYITHTNEKTHKIIHDNLSKASINNGGITSIGPRYCPSIELKIERFPDKASHQIFVEPESASTEDVYPNGISTSLPLDVQEEFIRSIKGFENAIITKPGYAVEYDFVLPNQLKHTLEVKKVAGLFLAGQINGTTGYEEAAGQGIIAGINAHLKAHNMPAFILMRHESYIGVMIDDLVSFGVDEPYRMFTSRAERRLLLRQDNAFYRLTDTSYNLGLIAKEQFDAIKEEQKIIDNALLKLEQNKNNQALLQLLGKDEQNIDRLHKLTENKLNARSIISLWAEIRYAPYLDREKKEITKAQKYQELVIPESFNYKDLPGLSKELQEKLIKHKPSTIAQAALISGMTPAAISLLILRIHEFEKMPKASKLETN
jgi:tRNA uridine 5-carboxymethylaminomethyl modification enzyme